MTTESRGKRGRRGKFLILMLFLLLGAAFAGSGLYARLSGDPGC